MESTAAGKQATGARLLTSSLECTRSVLVKAPGRFVSQAHTFAWQCGPVVQAEEWLQLAGPGDERLCNHSQPQPDMMKVVVLLLRRA